MTLRHWDTLLAKRIADVDLSTGITFESDDAFLLNQEAAEDGAAVDATIQAQAGRSGDASPGGALRLAGGDNGTPGGTSGPVVVDLGPEDSGATAALSVRSGSTTLLDVTGFSGTMAALVTAAGRTLTLISDTLIRLSVGSAMADLSYDDSLSLTLKRLILSSGQRQSVPQTFAGVSGNVTLDFDTAEKRDLTLSGATTFIQPQHVLDGARYTIRLRQDVVGNRTASWNSTYFKFGSLTGTLSTAAGALDIFEFEGGTGGVLHCITAAKGVHA